MEPDDLQILSQLIDSMDNLVYKLEEFSNKKDAENFNKTKKELLNLQSQAASILK